jgi:Short C-terminal domain
MVEQMVGRDARRSGWLLVASLAGSLLLYALLALLSAFGNQGPDGDSELSIVGFFAGVWLVFAILQVRWWRAGKAKFWRPTYGVLVVFVVVGSLIGIPTLLIPRWRRELFRIMKPDDDPVLDSLRRLDDIRAAGALTDQEYKAKKSEILSRI